MKNKIKKYLLEDLVETIEIIREVNKWEGGLEHIEMLPNDEKFFNEFFIDNPYGVALAISYGSYDINDSFVEFDGNGNLNSCSRKEYEDFLKKNIDDVVNGILELKFANQYLPKRLLRLMEE